MVEDLLVNHLKPHQRSSKSVTLVDFVETGLNTLSSSTHTFASGSLRSCFINNSFSSSSSGTNTDKSQDTHQPKQPMSRPFSLPKQARISGNNQFSCLLSLRPVGKSTFFKLYYRPYTNLTKSKSIPKFGQISFGVLIPKAQVAQSHHRNYLKRLVREYVRQKHPVLCSGQYLVRWVLPKKELEKNQSSPKVLSVPIHQALHSIFKPSLLKDLPDSFPHPQGS